MCVLLCANSNVHEWLDIPLALAHRQSLQLCAAYASALAEASSVEKVPQSPIAANFELDEAAQRRAMKRSAWLQAYCRYCSQLAQHRCNLAGCRASATSACDFQKALEAIAKTWGRFLSFVGLRW